MNDSRAAESAASHHLHALVASGSGGPGCHFDGPLSISQNDHVGFALGQPFLFSVPRHILIEHSSVFRAMLDPPKPESNAAGELEGETVLDLPDIDPDHFVGVLSVYFGQPFLLSP
ncbi:hypothetical protein BOTBODRAFT_180495 [Botryobasidium botryosum FD-172 SS1]|uniref:BTB domain-containing protein n=1 Tax=Botryobasidium botryosum (strain FD-172 SS1) TaxID=930990 RepID=A0A067LZ19_BOTB1|nr:hypothetical protein BOTBODRAFT_180495 [Botryobasidium botryosum FD-172 SS1]